MEHGFTAIIREILSSRYGVDGDAVYSNSQLLQYINEKTKSADRGSKSRSAYANLYALYVLVEDYISNDFDINGDYGNYEGAQYSHLLKRQRSLPFGSKLQNHALNNRLNAEFQSFFPLSEIVPVLRNLKTNRYWINENLLNININGKQINIAKAVVEIIDEYVRIKQDSFQRFIRQCQSLQDMNGSNVGDIKEFVAGLLAPNVDARLFEIVSFAILKYYYRGYNIIWGFSMDSLKEEELRLYKTGRTNANDGGIDFVMKPLGRFFQVTETLDFRKYFLDIEKIERYPITFVVKSVDDVESLRHRIYQDAVKTYVVEDVVSQYIGCIEDIINIPILLDCLGKLESLGMLHDVLNEIILQSKVEFNYDE